MRVLPYRQPVASFIQRSAGILDPVTRNWLIVAGGSFARLALGFIVSIVVARSLGPSAFGVYAVLAATGAIIGGLADVGLSGAAVRRTAASWPHAPERAREIWRAFFWLRMLITGVVAAAGILLAGPLAHGVLDLAGHETLLRITLVGVVATALSGTVTALLQATSHFSRLSTVMLTNASLTAVLALSLAQAGRLTLTTALVVLGISTSLASFAVGYRLLPGRWPIALPSRGLVRADGVDMLRFGGWLSLAGLLTMLAAQLDVLLVNHWGGPTTVGTYALALALASKADVVNHSLYTVLLPSASALNDPREVRHYIRRGLIRSAGISAALVLLIPFARPLITTFYGSDYAASAGLFQALVAVAIVDVFATPVLMLAFTYDRPRILTAASAARVVTLALVGVWLIPGWGASGAIAARLCASAAGVAVALALLIRQRRPADEVAVEGV